MALLGKKESGAPVTFDAAPVPSVWRAFQRQGAWKSWVMVALLGLLFLSLIANVQLASRTPEYVVVDSATGDGALVKHSVTNDALLRFLSEKTKPPTIAVVRFTRDFLHLALAVNSSTIEANWPASLAMMSTALRTKIAAEAAQQKLIETYKANQRKTDLTFESITLLDRTQSLLAIRAVVKRRVSPLLDNGGGPSIDDRIQVDVVEEIVPATSDHPDGLVVVEWRLAKLEPATATMAAAAAEPSK